MNWYALHCWSNSEKILCHRLEEAGFESYYPHLVIPGAHARRATEKKFFPGYLFARFDLNNPTPITRLPQVIGILGWQNRPVVIPESEVEAVRLMVDHSANTPELCSYIGPGEGDNVVVTRGPLQGLRGVVVYSKGQTRVVVSVTMLARSIWAEIDTDCLHLEKPAFRNAA